MMPPPASNQPASNQPVGAAGAAVGAVVVPGPLTEQMWEGSVEALHAYHFSIKNENRLAGTIETNYLAGSGLLEPWHFDSVTLADRIESSLQPIRRRAVVTLTAAEHGVVVAVQVIKEREDQPGPTRHAAGVASYPESRPLQRDLDVVLGNSTPTGWITLGRDTALEQALQKAIIARIGR